MAVVVQSVLGLVSLEVNEIVQLHMVSFGNEGSAVDLNLVGCIRLKGLSSRCLVVLARDVEKSKYLVAISKCI